MYRASSGALVFGAGTVQWAWGLNSNHDGDAQPATSQIMQQATVNLLADMGNVQPVTLMSGLVPATEVHGHYASDLDHHVAGRGSGYRERQHRHDQRERPPTAAAASSPE